MPPAIEDSSITEGERSQVSGCGASRPRRCTKPGPQARRRCACRATQADRYGQAGAFARSQGSSPSCPPCSVAQTVEQSLKGDLSQVRLLPNWVVKATHTCRKTPPDASGGAWRSQERRATTLVSGGRKRGENVRCTNAASLLGGGALRFLHRGPRSPQPPL